MTRKGNTRNSGTKVSGNQSAKQQCKHEECYPYAFFDEFNTMEPMLIVQCSTCDAHFAYPGKRITCDEE